MGFTDSLLRNIGQCRRESEQASDSRRYALVFRFVSVIVFYFIFAIMLWSTDLTLQFIEEMHSHRCLWDVSFTDYRNRELKSKTLTALAGKYSVSVAEIEKKNCIH